MPYTMEDFQREVKEEFLRSLTEEDLERLLKGLKPAKRLKGLKPEEWLKDLKLEEIDEIETCCQKIKAGLKDGESRR